MIMKYANKMIVNDFRVVQIARASPPFTHMPTRKNRPRTPARHPPYFEMVREALVALNNKKGSSMYAIAKYLEDNYMAVLTENFRKILKVQLKNCVARGRLIKIKASYKLANSVA